MLKIVTLASAIFVAGSSLAFAEGDAAAGEKVFRKCKACHMVGEKAKNRVGPMLNGIVGTAAGANESFKYSPAMKAAATDGLDWSNGPLVWTEENLAVYLAAPKKSIPKNKMAFAGLKKDEDIANVIAYLKTFPAQ